LLQGHLTSHFLECGDLARLVWLLFIVLFIRNLRVHWVYRLLSLFSLCLKTSN